MNTVELAQRLKALRVENGLTLSDVASRAGLTRSWLSKVENFRVTPSLPALASIAGVLGVSMSELFEGLDERPRLVIVRKNERPKVRRDEDISLLSYESLASSRAERAMDPFVITVPPADSRPRLGHDGEEFLYVLAGRITLEFEDATHTLDTGDSAYFDAELPHRVSCEGPDAAEILVVFHQGSAVADLDDHRTD